MTKINVNMPISTCFIQYTCINNCTIFPSVITLKGGKSVIVDRYTS